jgi:hypothetical protein
LNGEGGRGLIRGQLRVRPELNSDKGRTSFNIDIRERGRSVQSASSPTSVYCKLYRSNGIGHRYLPSDLTSHQEKQLPLKSYPTKLKLSFLTDKTGELSSLPPSSETIFERYRALSLDVRPFLSTL